MFSKRLNEAEKTLKNKIYAFESKAQAILQEMLLFTWKQFDKQYLTDRSTKGTIKQAFEDYASGLREAGQVGTAVTYACAKNNLEKFANEVTFKDVTPVFLLKYERWMLDNENSITTIGIYLRSLRTLFNNAIDEATLTREYYPFGKKRYEIPTANNVKKSLSLTDISLIYYYPVKTGTLSAMAKNYKMFMYLCNGINMKDVCLLKYDIKGEILQFVRAKTARTKRRVEPIRIVITEDVGRIIAIYGNKDTNPANYIFPFFRKGITPEEERQIVQQLTKVVNANMAAIATTLKITGKVTTYSTRHSFATILQRSGVSTEFISEALGHSNTAMFSQLKNI